MRECKFICFPHAGGSSSSYPLLTTHLEENSSVSFVDYSGRGNRISEPLLVNMNQLVTDIWQQIESQLSTPYVLFGHSMGALIAFLIAHRIRQEKKHPPLHLFLSGMECPATPHTEMEYLLPQTTFKERLSAYGGLPSEILDNDEYFSFFAPIIRADMQAVETWQYSPIPKLSIPTTIMNGLVEAIKEKEIKGWQKEFDTPITFKKFMGGHFFIENQAQEVASFMLKNIS